MSLVPLLVDAGGKLLGTISDGFSLLSLTLLVAADVFHQIDPCPDNFRRCGTVVRTLQNAGHLHVSDVKVQTLQYSTCAIVRRYLVQYNIQLELNMLK
jgi:hypothetical protein